MSATLSKILNMVQNIELLDRNQASEVGGIGVTIEGGADE